MIQKQFVFLFLISCLLAILTLSIESSCTVEDQYKVDCGYVGITQDECQAKGCCWDPESVSIELTKRFLKEEQNGVPWCYYPDSCSSISFSASDPGFTETWYQNMYNDFLNNIDIEQKGGVCASPDKQHPTTSSSLKDTYYYYHWTRDGGLSMRAFIEINSNNLTAIQTKMQHYVQWVLNVQSETDPSGIDIRVEPKFELPDGSPYTGGWCRPQTDGPAIQSLTLIMFANILLDNQQDAYVKQYLWTGDSSVYRGGAIVADLDWVYYNYQSNGCDLWEEVQSSDFFWNVQAFQKTMSMASDLATRLGDTASATKYSSLAQTLIQQAQRHYNGQYIYESTNRQVDSSVIHAIVSYGLYSPTSVEVANTVSYYNNAFCHEYPLNSADIQANIPGILYGRYPGDTYEGGNPWQLLSAALAQLFYQQSIELSQLDKNQYVQKEKVAAWKQILNLSEDATVEEFELKSFSAGDSVLQRIYTHVKNDNYRIDEQMDKNSGAQKSAQYLTWSYASILKALKLRQFIQEQRK